MKLKTTNKEIQSNFSKIVKIGYCKAQYLLHYKSPFSYTCGVYGWNADFYQIGNACISTGYRTIGDSVDYSLLLQLEKQAQDICLDYSINDKTKEKQIDELLNELLNSLNK